jgi:membrane dipeptidase
MIQGPELPLSGDAMIIDAVCPLPMDHPDYLSWYREGGAAVLGLTMSSTENARGALDRIAKWHRILRERPDLILVRTAGDAVCAKRSNSLGLFLHLQGTEPIENNLDLVDLYKALGVGMVQLTYNVRNHVGDGCEEGSDAGLSRFGIRLIERLNRARVIVDCSHTGLRTSLQAIEHSTAPVVLSHSNVNSVHVSPRNVPDVLIDAIAKSGGIIGIAGFPAMVSASTMPSLEQFIAHISAIATRVGIDHVGLGIDYYSGQADIANDDEAMRVYESSVRNGLWGSAYPPPPHHYPAGIETPRLLFNLAKALSKHGFDEVDVAKILGLNWLRVMRDVWG